MPKCYTCNGTGKVKSGYYECTGEYGRADHAEDRCRMCEGSGISNGLPGLEGFLTRLDRIESESRKPCLMME